MLATNSDPYFTDLQHIANKIKWKVEKQLQEMYSIFDVVEDMTSTIPLADQQDLFYMMKIQTDGNGHIIAKVRQDHSGKDWAWELEAYDRGRKPIESEES